MNDHFSASVLSDHRNASDSSIDSPTVQGNTTNYENNVEVVDRSFWASDGNDKDDPYPFSSGPGTDAGSKTKGIQKVSGTTSI